MSRRRHPQPRRVFATSKALAAFVVTAVLAVVATVTLLWPDIATKAADGMAQAPHHLEQWLPAGLFD